MAFGEVTEKEVEKRLQVLLNSLAHLRKVMVVGEVTEKEV